MSDEKALEKEQEGHQKNSVFDFLYQDTKRIGSFLSQFDENGLLREIRQNETVTEATQRGMSVSVTGGASIAGTGGQGGISFERPPGSSGSEGAERTYDPLWANSLALLDYLSEYGGIKLSLNDSRIGQFVLIEANLNIVDLGMIKDFYQNDMLRKHIVNENDDSDEALNRKQRRALKKPKADEKPSELELIFQMMGIFPHSIHLRASSADGNCWATLNKEGLVTDAGSLFLKFGNSIPGTWHILAVVDSRPEDDSRSVDTIPELGPTDLYENGLAALFTILGPVIRPILGRPNGDYGITPILIFRKTDA